MSKPLRLGGKSTRPSSRSSRSTSSRAASSAPAPRVGVGRSGVPRPDYGNVKPKKTHIQLESGRQYYDSADDNMKGVFRSSDADGGGAAPNALGLAGGREASGGGGGAAGSFADVRKEHEQRQHGAHSGDRVEAPQNPQVDDGQPSPQRAHPQSVASPITSTRALTGKKVSSSSNLISASSPSSAAAGSSPEQVQNHSVLLVEDVRVSQRIARVALSRAHFHVEVATDGEDAVNKFKQALVDANSTSSAPSAGALGLGVQAAPDSGADDESGSASLTRRGFAVVLMNIQLPKMNGIEATRIIRELEAKEGTPPAAIFGLTGSVADEELEEYKHAGMNGCIAKGNVLKTAVEKALAAYHANPDEFFVSKV